MSYRNGHLSTDVGAQWETLSKLVSTAAGSVSGLGRVRTVFSTTDILDQVSPLPPTLRAINVGVTMDARGSTLECWQASFRCV